MAIWHTVETARARWRDAPGNSEVEELLDLAQFECVLFAPPLLDAQAQYLAVMGVALPAGQIPPGWRAAQLLHMRSIWRYMQINGDDDGPSIEGIGGIRVYPMDANVRRRLRPNDGIPAVG